MERVRKPHPGFFSQLRLTFMLTSSCRRVLLSLRYGHRSWQNLRSVRLITSFLLFIGTATAALKCAALPGAGAACAGERVVGTQCIGACTTASGKAGQGPFMCYDQGASSQMVYWKPVKGTSSCTGVCIAMAALGWACRTLVYIVSCKWVGCTTAHDTAFSAPSLKLRSPVLPNMYGTLF